MTEMTTPSFSASPYWHFVGCIPVWIKPAFVTALQKQPRRLIYGLSPVVLTVTTNFKFHSWHLRFRHFFCHNQNKRKIPATTSRPLKCKHQVHTFVLTIAFVVCCQILTPLCISANFKKLPDRSVSSHTLLANLPSQTALNQKISSSFLQLHNGSLSLLLPVTFQSSVPSHHFAEQNLHWCTVCQSNDLWFQFSRRGNTNTTTLRFSENPHRFFPITPAMRTRTTLSLPVALPVSLIHKCKNRAKTFGSAIALFIYPNRLVGAFGTIWKSSQLFHACETL